jgi:hypothetical protein
VSTAESTIHREGTSFRDRRASVRWTGPDYVPPPYTQRNFDRVPSKLVVQDPSRPLDFWETCEIQSIPNDTTESMENPSKTLDPIRNGSNESEPIDRLVRDTTHWQGTSFDQMTIGIVWNRIDLSIES